MEKIEKPWGCYEILADAPNYKVKRITVNPESRLSLQMHYHREEQWVLVCGSGKVTVGDQHYFLNCKNTINIPAGVKHRVENPGKIPLIFIEVQTGEYLEEDDIVRYEDDYDRIDINRRAI